MLIDYDVAVVMRDGVEIYVDVFRPGPAGKVPVIIAWGPYGKHAPVKYDIFPNHGVDPSWISKYAAPAICSAASRAGRSTPSASRCT